MSFLSQINLTGKRPAAARPPKTIQRRRLTSRPGSTLLRPTLRSAVLNSRGCVLISFPVRTKDLTPTQQVERTAYKVILPETKDPWGKINYAARKVGRAGKFLLKIAVPITYAAGITMFFVSPLTLPAKVFFGWALQMAWPQLLNLVPALALHALHGSIKLWEAARIRGLAKQGIDRKTGQITNAEKAQKLAEILEGKNLEKVFRKKFWTKTNYVLRLILHKEGYHEKVVGTVKLIQDAIGEDDAIKTADTAYKAKERLEKILKNLKARNGKNLPVYISLTTKFTWAMELNNTDIDTVISAAQAKELLDKEPPWDFSHQVSNAPDVKKELDKKLEQLQSLHGVLTAYESPLPDIKDRDGAQSAQTEIEGHIRIIKDNVSDSHPIIANLEQRAEQLKNLAAAFALNQEFQTIAPDPLKNPQRDIDRIEPVLKSLEDIKNQYPEIQELAAKLDQLKTLKIAKQAAINISLDPKRAQTIHDLLLQKFPGDAAKRALGPLIIRLRAKAQRPAPKTRKAGADDATAADAGPPPAPGAGAAEPPPVPRVFDNIGKAGKYCEIVKIGEKGAMGDIFIVENEGGTKYALKRPKPQEDEESDISYQKRIFRFQREIRILQALAEDPNVVTIVDVQNARFPEFYVMEHIEGEDLSGYLTRIEVKDGEEKKRRVSLEIPATLRIVKQIIEGLIAYENAFSEDLEEIDDEEGKKENSAHRDLKPANIMLDLVPGTRTVKRAAILDWGIARTPKSSATSTGTFIGTPNYAAPEMFLGSEVADRRSDIYSLGRILLTTLTAKAGYVIKDVENAANRAQARKWGFYVAKQEKVLKEKHIPPQLIEIIMKALQPDPKERQQSYRELFDELVRYERGESPPTEREKAKPADEDNGKTAVTPATAKRRAAKESGAGTHTDLPQQPTMESKILRPGAAAAQAPADIETTFTTVRQTLLGLRGKSTDEIRRGLEALDLTVIEGFSFGPELRDTIHDLRSSQSSPEDRLEDLITGIPVKLVGLARKEGAREALHAFSSSPEQDS